MTFIERARAKAYEFAMSRLSESQRLHFSVIKAESAEELYPQSVSAYLGHMAGAEWAAREVRATEVEPLKRALELYAGTAGGVWGGDSRVVTIHYSDVEPIPVGPVLVPFGGKTARLALAAQADREREG